MKFSRYLILTGFLIFCAAFAAEAKIGNTRYQNAAQYGQALEIEEFKKSNLGFTGYMVYSADSSWKIKAFYINDKVRSEHLVPKDESQRTTLSRSQVRAWSAKMFDHSKRGSYQKKLSLHRAEGHFFSKGLVAYEYYIEGRATKGYKGVKVLLYENNQSYWSINPKAYI